MKFTSSENSQEIINTYNEMFGQIVTPVVLLKALSIHSAKLDFLNTALNILCVAPTRQFKTQTTKAAITLFKQTDYIEAGSDFTIHAINREYKGDVNKKCIIINDATLLLSSKDRKTKERLINGLAELLSDKKYHYGDFMLGFDIKGHASVIMNMTPESYEHNKEYLFGSTFLERFTTIFYKMTEEEIKNYSKMTLNNHKIKFTCKLKKRTITKNPTMDEETKIIAHSLAEEYSILSEKSQIGCLDQIIALLKTHATFNGRDKINEDDIMLAKIVKDYLIDPYAPNNHKIIMLYKQGRSIKDICNILNKNYESYRPFVAKIIKKAMQRGII